MVNCTKHRRALEVVLTQCSRSKEVHHGRRVHAELKKLGYHRETYLGNLLVLMYAKCGCSEEAFEAFTLITLRNVFTWNNLLLAFSHSADVHACEVVFRKMAHHNPVSFNLLISANANHGHLLRAKELLFELPTSSITCCTATIVAFGEAGQCEALKDIFFAVVGRDIVAWNALISAYAVNGHLQNANEVFVKIPYRNVITWTTMLGIYSRSGNLKQARITFNTMPEKNTISWNTLINGYAICRHSRDVKDLFDQMSGRNVETWNSTLLGLTRGALWNESSVLFERMPEHDLVTWNVMLSSGDNKQAKCTYEQMPTRDVVSGNTIIKSSLENDRLDDAVNTFKSMPQHTLVSWNLMIQGYAEYGDLPSSNLIFECMPERNVVSWTAMVSSHGHSGCVENARFVFNLVPHWNVVTWNTMLAAYAQHGYASDALELFRAMDLEGISTLANEITFSIAIDSCTTQSSVSLGRLLHEDIAPLGLQLDSILTTALINLYGKCGELPLARLMFNAYLSRDHRPVVEVWNAMIAAYSENGFTNPVLELFGCMQLQGVNPNVVTFVSLLSACSHGGVLSSGMNYFASIEPDFGITLTDNHYECVLDLLSRAGLLQQAKDLAEKMPCSPLIWRTLLSAYKNQVDVKEGVDLGVQSLVNVPESDVPACYAIVSNLIRTYPS